MLVLHSISTYIHSLPLLPLPFRCPKGDWLERIDGGGGGGGGG